MSQINVGIVNSTGGVQLPSFTTANLPTTGISAGFLAFDSTDGVVKVYDGNAWKKLTDATVNATGGDEVYSQGQYKIHKFYNSGTFNVVDSDANAYMDFIIVGGGGGGGCSDGNCSNGGGGAGGLVYKSNVALAIGLFETDPRPRDKRKSRKATNGENG